MPISISAAQDPKGNHRPGVLYMPWLFLSSLLWKEKGLWGEGGKNWRKGEIKFLKNFPIWVSHLVVICGDTLSEFLCDDEVEKKRKFSHTFFLFKIKTSSYT